MKPGPCSARIWETVRNMDRAPLGHPCLEAAPEVEAVAIMMACAGGGARFFTFIA